MNMNCSSKDSDAFESLVSGCFALSASIAKALKAVPNGTRAIGIKDESRGGYSIVDMDTGKELGFVAGELREM